LKTLFCYAVMCYIIDLERENEMNDYDEENEEDNYYFHHSASLRIFGDIPDFDFLTNTLGLEPEHTHRKGERAIIRSLGVLQTDGWIAQCDVAEDEKLDVHLDALWEKLKPHKEFLLELKKTHKVDVYCSYRSNSSTAGVLVDYRSLEIFRGLEMPFSLSIIVAGDELRQALRYAMNEQKENSDD
jgi:hypothetical protein